LSRLKFDKSAGLQCISKQLLKFGLLPVLRLNLASVAHIITKLRNFRIKKKTRDLRISSDG
jgi:hypothetical protein